MFIHIKKQSPKPSVIYDTYWKFAAERQAIFFKRINNKTAPWTRDSILNVYKFTNAYRASDRVSQFLIQNVIYAGIQDIEEVFFRILLFKSFNKIDTWNYLINQLGGIRAQTFDFKTYSNRLNDYLNAGNRVYSGAYIMTSGKSFFGYDRKFQNHLRLIEKMLKEQLPQRIATVKEMESVYSLLKSYPTIGEFLAFQYTIDINYSCLTDFSEMDFVKAGPGAKNGIRKCFKSLGDYSDEDVIKMVADKQFIEFERLGLSFECLWGRPLQLIDCQNLFCEVDKYSRVAFPEISDISGRIRIKQKYIPKFEHSVNLWYPPKWNINHLIP